MDFIKWEEFGLAGLVIATLFAYQFFLIRVHRDERLEWKLDANKRMEEWKHDAERRSDKHDAEALRQSDRLELVIRDLTEAVKHERIKTRRHVDPQSKPRKD